MGTYKNLTFTNTSEVLFQVLVINHMYFMFVNLSIASKPMELQMDSTFHKCFLVYRHQQNQVNALILKTH